MRTLRHLGISILLLLRGNTLGFRLLWQDFTDYVGMWWLTRKVLAEARQKKS